MAGLYSSDDITVTLEDAPGGTARNIENFILNGISIKHSAEFVDTTALGDNFRERTPTGVEDSSEVTLSGTWDTTATTGSHAVFGTVDDGPQDDGREMVVTWGDSKTWTCDYRLVEYEIVASVDNIQTFNARLVPTGAGAWA